MRDLGRVNGWAAAAVNNHGQVTGASGGHAFLWSPEAGMADLGTLHGGYWSQACGVNDLGQVVGQFSFADGNGWTYGAFVWEETTGMTELPSLGGSYGSACAIEDAGIIAGYSATGAADGTTHAVLWVPIPEASSLLALSAGLVWAGAMLRRRRRQPGHRPGPHLVNPVNPVYPCLLDEEQPGPA